MKFFLAFLCILFISCSEKRTSSEAIVPTEYEEYQLLRKMLKKDEVPYDSILGHLEELENDSLRNKFFIKFAYHFHLTNDSTKFRKWNKKALDLSIKRADTSNIAESYWDRANFFYQRNHVDSAYYYYNKSYLFYEKTEDDFLTGMMLMNMAIIQQNIKDYIGSEVTTIKAIEKIKHLEKKGELYKAYNNLGIIYNELGEYEKSQKYHSLALEYKKNIDPVLKASNLNNIGVVLKNSGKTIEAIKKFNKALSVDSLGIKDPGLHAMLMDNLAHARMLSGDTSGIRSLFQNALEIRERIDHKAGISINKLHLSEYFLLKEDTTQAIELAVQAKEMAGSIKNFRDILSSMLLLSEIDKENAHKYLKDYIKISDSLQREEREVRNKFARIRFETDEYIAENEVLTEQRKWVIGGATGSLLILGLLFVIRSQKAHYRKLQLEQAQQRANEDIYNLLLEQENKIEEGRSKEKERISMELHDGVVGKIFGIRMILGSLISKNDASSIKAQENYLQELQGIENEIREISHNLNTVVATAEVGFLVLVKKLLEEQEKIANIDFRLKTDESIHWDSINNRVKIHFFRIVQEAVQNINKYAEAEQATVAFQKQGNSIILEISDNGNGFQVEKKNEGIGLKNIRSRVKDMKGEIKIRSDKKGTNITIKIPLELWKKS